MKLQRPLTYAFDEPPLREDIWISREWSRTVLDVPTAGRASTSKANNKQHIVIDNHMPVHPRDDDLWFPSLLIPNVSLNIIFKDALQLLSSFMQNVCLDEHTGLQMISRVS